MSTVSYIPREVPVTAMLLTAAEKQLPADNPFPPNLSHPGNFYTGPFKAPGPLFDWLLDNFPDLVVNVSTIRGQATIWITTRADMESRDGEDPYDYWLSLRETADLLNRAESDDLRTGNAVLGREGTEAANLRGVVTHVNERCRLAGCSGVRVRVRWPDGKITKPCSHGLRKVGPSLYQII